MMAKGPDKNIVSGNSRVKVTIYGQVNRAIRLASSGGDSQIQSVDNDGSSSRIVIHAVGQANPNLTIGAHHSLEWQENRRSATRDTYKADGNTRLRSRNVELWLAHKDFGTLHMGKGSIAADAADLFSKSGVGYVFGSAGYAADGFFAAGVWATRTVNDKTEIVNRGYRNFAFFGARENRIMYTTPNVMGASAAVSYSQNKSFSAAVTYAGAPPGVKNFSLLFKAGFRTDPNKHNDGAGDDAFVDGVYTKAGKSADTPSRTAWGVSGGIEHTSSGFSISGGYGGERKKGVKERPYNWYADVGWKGNVNSMGTTAIGVGYFKSTDGGMLNAQQYWAAINQEVKAAAADVYAGVAYDNGEAPYTESDDLGDDDVCGDANMAEEKCAVDRDGVFVFIAGVRIKF